MVEVDVTDPRGVTFMRWASLLSESLAQYNVPSPVSEGLWQEWATTLLAVPEITELGVASPSAFRDWRVWAQQFLQVI